MLLNYKQDFGKYSDFIKEINNSLLRDILNSHYIVINLKTTALTKYARPTAVGKSTKIGPSLTWYAYQRAYGGGINCTPRARIIAFQLGNAQKIAVNLDAIPVEDARTLATALLDNKIVIGHNLSFDFSWLKHFTDAKPALVLDTLLIIRCIKPGLSWRVYEKAYNGDTASLALIEKMTDNSASLEFISVALGLGEPDRTWQHPRNWCVENLSNGHFEYVVGDVDAPLQVLKTLTGANDIHAIIKALRHKDSNMGSTYFNIYQYVPMTLAQMHINGMPLHAETLEIIHQHRADQIAKLANEVMEKIPALKIHERTLKSLATSLPQSLKDDLSTYLKDHGFNIDYEDGKAVLNGKVVKLAGASVLDGWKAWEKLQGAKKALSFCQEFKMVSERDTTAGFRRLHPLISASTVTLRTNSKLPNSQNLPRPDADLDDMLQIRSSIHARPGSVLVSADYGQIELRIAGALAQRAFQETIDIFNGNSSLKVPQWFREALALAESNVELIARDVSDDELTFDDYKIDVAIAWRNVKKNGLVMAEIFRKGVDPHLSTGVGMAVRQKLMNDVGNVVNYLYNASPEHLDILKRTYKAQRQAAKALNFGLLYGMGVEKLWSMGITDYGLNWTVQEATDARNAWFDMFADIKWWQTFEGIAKRMHKDVALPILRRSSYTGEIERTHARLYITKTLAGRPVLSMEKRGALNYSDQGTGADMALYALTHIADMYKPMLINIIHDEIMLEVPETLALLAEKELQRVMLEGANMFLSAYNIPAEANPGRSIYWKKE